MAFTNAKETSSGQRQRLVTLQAVTQSIGPQRFPIETMETLATVWASRSDLSAEERFVSDRESAVADTSWQIPYREDMDPELVDVPKTRRLVYQGRGYDIRSATPVGWKRHIELITLARVG